MPDFSKERFEEIKKEKIEECLKDPTLIGDLVDDLEIYEKQIKRKDYQIKCLQKDLKNLNNRLMEKNNGD